VLIASREPGPYVLVGHSWGGLIARLFASTYPDEVAGLVLVDSASEFLKSSLTPAQWATYIEATKKLIESNGLEAPDHARTLGLLHSSPRVRPVPVVLLTSDKRFDFGARGAENVAGVANRSASSRKASQRETPQRHEQRPCDPDGAATTGDRFNSRGGRRRA
jgi:pimeloyl-ACP methyl ester carboxylesterase